MNDNVNYVGLWHPPTRRGRVRAAIKALRGRPIGCVTLTTAKFHNLTISGPIIFGTTTVDGGANIEIEGMTWTKSVPVWVESSDGNHWTVRP